MSAAEENFDTVADESSGDEDRERAISELETANECAKLADLVRMDSLDARYREQALEGLGHPQCRSTLETIVDDGDVPESLRDRAETLLEELPGDPGDVGDMGRL